MDWNYGITQREREWLVTKTCHIYGSTILVWIDSSFNVTCRKKYPIVI